MKPIVAVMSHDPPHSLIQDLLRMLNARWQKAAVIRRLELMDDRQLSDIGFSRATIRGVVRKGYR
jgi:uncharacterized protein YjiS (DUF1127 family)